MENNPNECIVCRDEYSKRLRKPIQCPYCQFSCCMTCFRQYLVTLASEPACMSCKVQFSYEFLHEKLPITFWHGEYKDFRKTLLVSREESLLPDTQNCITRIHRKDQFYRHVRAFRSEIDKMLVYYNKLVTRNGQMTEMVIQERNGELEIPDDHPYFLYFNDDNTLMKNDKGELLCMMDKQDEEAVKHRVLRRVSQSTWVHACPKSDCRGYLKGEQTICPVCNTRVCKDCLQIMPEEDGHECKNEDIETVDMLKQNTKACPNCSIMIYKISGCDQMWCTQCRTPFSWKTGQRINQRIHNPHYYEWMQRHPGDDIPRELMDIPCGGLPTVNSLRIFPRLYWNWVHNLHQHILHCEHVIVPRYQNTQELEGLRKSMRISYLLNSISHQAWRDELYSKEKAAQKHQQYVQIMQTFVAVSTEWLRRMIIKIPSNLKEEINEIVSFFRYINNQIKMLNNRFKSSLASIPNDLLLDQGPNVRI